jgi:hypothetical protein
MNTENVSTSFPDFFKLTRDIGLNIDRRVIWAQT